MSVTGLRERYLYFGQTEERIQARHRESCHQFCKATHRIRHPEIRAHKFLSCCEEMSGVSSSGVILNVQQPTRDAGATNQV